MSLFYIPAKEDAFKVFTRVGDFVKHCPHSAIKLTRSQLKILWELVDETDEDADNITIFQKNDDQDVLAYGSEETMPYRMGGSTPEHD